MRKRGTPEWGSVTMTSDAEQHAKKEAAQWFAIALLQDTWCRIFSRCLQELPGRSRKALTRHGGIRLTNVPDRILTEEYFPTSVRWTSASNITYADLSGHVYADLFDSMVSCQEWGPHNARDMITSVDLPQHSPDYSELRHLSACTKADLIEAILATACIADDGDETSGLSPGAKMTVYRARDIVENCIVRLLLDRQDMVPTRLVDLLAAATTATYDVNQTHFDLGTHTTDTGTIIQAPTATSSTSLRDVMNRIHGLEKETKQRLELINKERGELQKFHKEELQRVQEELRLLRSTPGTDTATSSDDTSRHVGKRSRS